ncbi:hypothetical protein [Cupriavidus taiwanensis]|uniref:Autotransporter domain-containing protein n=1 Tax=Cupriavidus taiwanensis TaxID=164546 RepID=A0A7Z7J679_9BURK|nr:hypothetical protein [Cupriavidus taiwanensis]SOY55436.1 conserved hypothetical protein; putative exported protein [Cupriavidus taiwanensis]SOY86476.1 conserved hypothetical protein; putative exported protein [Cupriavidus taiwanensis]SOZ01616.1 conserved hypothetical protein; putative exported protein [Cupriavidus taiwanensis]SOZ04658.1 conserved hypothetical protein; putative exported protein [Cupriavidus taiwanensis]SPC09138.1 conserved hypothetical protein; putative exported protein [Cup
MFMLLAGLAAAPRPALAQAEPAFRVVGTNVQKHASAVLTLMSFAVVPDLASSSLSITNANTESPDLTLWQLGGGFTLSQSFPLYLEGSIAYNRYDPTFVASNGLESRKLPTKWNTFAGTVGVGWDFPLIPSKELVFRPIFNASLGRVASDLSIAQFAVEHKTDRDVAFLDDGTMNAYGLGGSVMLDWESHRDNRDIDVELRYTNIYLRSFGDSSGLEASSAAQTASLYARWRAPTGMRALDRPVRYVLELSHSHYFGSQAGALGFNYLTTLGTGLELDTSAHEVFVTRIRAVVRYVFGNNVSGVSFGLAASF